MNMSRLGVIIAYLGEVLKELKVKISFRYFRAKGSVPLVTVERVSFSVLLLLYFCYFSRPIIEMALPGRGGLRMAGRPHFWMMIPYFYRNMIKYEIDNGTGNEYLQIPGCRIGAD